MQNSTFLRTPPNPCFEELPPFSDLSCCMQFKMEFVILDRVVPLHEGMATPKKVMNKELGVMTVGEFYDELG